ncbi:hypothetical protein chiPu_0026653, partial [Chiloscyllium punctatum]|nr:hypothetical protein [Chiloscyllium punctatum]
PLAPGPLCYAKLELPSSREPPVGRPAPTPYSETLPMLKISRAGGAAKQHRQRARGGGDGSLSRGSPRLPDGSARENTDLYSSVQVGTQEGRTEHQQYVNKETLKI